MLLQIQDDRQFDDVISRLCHSFRSVMKPFCLTDSITKTFTIVVSFIQKATTRDKSVHFQMIISKTGV